MNTPLIFKDGTPQSRVERKLRRDAGVVLTTDEGFTLTTKGAQRVIDIAAAASVLLGACEAGAWSCGVPEATKNLREAIGNKFDEEDLR